MERYPDLLCISLFIIRQEITHIVILEKVKKTQKHCLLKKAHKCILQNVLGKTLNLGVLDSGCTKTVCGEEGLKCYVDSLGEEESIT